MAAETGIPSVYLEHQLSHGRATKKTRGTLIEKLRKKSFHNHSWTDSIKSVRSFVAERRTQIENTEPSGVQQCLDTLQKAMKVKSQQTLKERLDLIGRHLGLNTQISDQKVSLGTDTFQVDVLLGDGGIITNVKLANQGDVVDCPDLKDILKKGDFSEFIEHLQGLQSIYQVTSDEKLKSKAFLALQALEKDLNQLAQFQSSISGVANYIHKCPLGIMLPRLAGKPMKLIYFVSPYDLLDKKSLAAHPLTVEAITENFLGQSVTVCIEPVPESAPANKLQTMPLMNVNKTQDGKSLPSFSAVSKINSMMLPASFVLVLPRSIPVSTQILQKITAQTNLEIHKEADAQSLRSLILETFSGGSIKECRRLFVSLPDQQHIYFLDCLNGGSQEHQGVMVSRIPFTHPTHVPQILNLMRQQLLFNIIIGSCVRPGSKKESPNSIVFEVTAISLQQLTIVFEHPAYDSMIRVDIDLSDITNLKCKVACTNSDQILCSDEAISRVFHRCMSIPIMLRWLIAKGRGHLDKLKEAAALIAKRELLEKALFLKELQQQQAKLQPTTLPTNRPPPQPPHPPPLPPSPSYSHHHSPVHIPHSNGQAPPINPMLAETRGIMFNEFLQMTDNNSKHINNRLVMSPDIEHAHNPFLTTFLDDEKELSGVINQKEVHDSPMLSQLLDDNTSVATTVIPMNCKPVLMASVKRQRKRRQQSDFSGPSPKHHISDNDLTEHLGSFSNSMDLDMGSNMDHNLHNTPSPVMRSVTPTHGSSGHHHPLLTRTANAARSQNNVIDLTEDSTIGESSLKKLADSMDKHLVHKDVKSEPDLSMLLNEAEAQSRIPNILQNNSPSSSKNENASTSLEVILKGSGEVGRAKDFDPSDAASVHSSTTCSKLSSLLLGTSDSPLPHLSASPHKANSVFFNHSVGCDESYGVNVGKSVSNSIFLRDMKVSSASQSKGTLYQSPNVELTNDKKCITGIFDKFDISRQQKNVKIDTTNNDLKSQPECKVSLRLRVGPLKQQNRVKPFVKSCKSVDEADLYGKSNSIRTFDFKSDEDDDDPLLQFSSERYVCASSPTRLQISSNKHKQLNDYASVPQKSDKTKKKDRSSGNTTKRKREKYESKREKKRKKSEHFIQDSLYRTVENDTKADFKLKIRVAKKPVTDKSDVFSDGKVPSYEITKKPLVSSHDKLHSSKEEVKESVTVVSDIAKEKDSSAVDSNTHKIVSGKSSAHVNKSSPKSGSSRIVQSSCSGSKTDPKLVTKATIRLKPLTMPNSGSTVNISQSGSKISGSVSGSNKTERRGSSSTSTPVLDKRSAANSLERKSSTSNLGDRRSATQSLSSAVSSSVTLSTPITTATTPTTMANLSLSSILPNAPTISKIASLPRIPKLSSSSSSTSISRTSSLDPVSGSSPTSAGTKSNNSYTVGPAGRSSSSTASGPGGSRSSSGGAASFNYSSRHTASGNGGAGNNWPNFSSGRPGLAHRQTSPLINTGQVGSQKLSGSRVQSPVSNKAGIHSSNSHRHSGNFSDNSVKGSTGSSNSPQKTFSSSVKANSVIGSKMGNNFIGQKSNSGSGNTVSGQRHINHNTYPVNSTQISGNSCIINRSPNTSGSTKSPNSGKSQNLTSSGRSPSLNSASKSPNISTVNKSPNLSSSNSGKSPNLTPARSPSISNNSVRPASNASSKSAASVSHRHLHSENKSASVNKSIIKTPHLSTSQRTSKNISGSIKPSPAKTGHKTTIASSNTLHALDSNSVPAQHASPGSIPVNTNSSSILSSTEPASLCPTQKSSQSQIKPVSSPITTSLPQQLSSVVKAASFDQTDPHKNSIVSTTVNETTKLLTSGKHSTPTTPYSADGKKSKFNFCSSLSKGRKNSLSAIVDKLKHNAVGAVLDSAGILSTFADGQTTMPVKAFSDSEELKSDVKSSVNSPNSLRQTERKTSSQHSLNTVEHFTTADGVHKKINHLLDGNQVKNICKVSGDENTSASVSLSSVISLRSETDCTRKSDMLSNEMSCDRTKNVEERSHCVSKTADAKYGRNDSCKEQSCSDIGNIKPDINFAKEKRVPHKVNLLKQCLVSSVQESSFGSGSTPASPLASQSPSTFKNTSPIIVPNCSVSKSLKHLSDQVFKLPSTKSSGDNLDEESRAFEVLSYSPELRDSKLDSICSGATRDSLNRWPQDDKTAQYMETRTSSKPPSSPLSDISSPENGLIIDDADLKASGKISGRKIVTKPQSPKSARNETTRNISQVPKDKTGSIPSSFNCTPLSSSPKTSQPSSAKSPTFAKNPSGASSPKDSDSPCPIDDDLMDMALGFGS